jgi:hypothetical protein
VLPYLLLSPEDSALLEHDLRTVFNGVRYIARSWDPYLPRVVDEMKKLADRRKGNGAAWGSLTVDLRIRTND